MTSGPRVAGAWRPGFESFWPRLRRPVGAVYCLEASRLARNGRDWHHLIDLCALAGTLVIDHEGTYDPRLINDRLLLGLKGTMSEYELSLMRQRGLAARDAEGPSWRVPLHAAARLLLERGRLDPARSGRACSRRDPARLPRSSASSGSGRQVFLWMRQAGIKMPVVQSQRRRSAGSTGSHPPTTTSCRSCRTRLYVGAYAFGRNTSRIEDCRRASSQDRAAMRKHIAELERHCSTTITRATSAGRSTRRTKICFWKTPT